MSSESIASRSSMRSRPDIMSGKCLLRTRAKSGNVVIAGTVPSEAIPERIDLWICPRTLM